MVRSASFSVVQCLVHAPARRSMTLWSVKFAGRRTVSHRPQCLLSQQFSISAGRLSARGYGSAEISGDNGIAGSIRESASTRLSTLPT